MGIIKRGAAELNRNRDGCSHQPFSLLYWTILGLGCAFLISSVGMAGVTSTSFTPYISSAIPNPYYLNESCPGQSLAGLQEATGIILVPYQEGDFDCGEMAAYLQWRLKSQGYDAKICLARDFKNRGCHAWVAVDIKGTRYFIEPTTPSLIPMGPNDKYYSPYDNYTWIFYSIDEMLEHTALTEVDWWNEIDFETAMDNGGWPR